MRVDLHIHTTASDGKLTPAQVVEAVAGLGLEVIAITDHDSVDGIASALEAARAFPKLTVIPGVEINTDIPGDEVHILGYFVDCANQELLDTLERMRNSRQRRALKMVQKLARLGVHIEWPRVLELAGGGAVGRPHVAQAMLERGYIASLQEAFARYIGRNGPAYAERERLTPAQATALVMKAGGLPVLAHPASLDRLNDVLIRLKGAGLVGLEAYYDGYSPEVTRSLVELARKHGLITCGGSDFHGLEGGVGVGLGSVEVPFEAAQQLIALAQRKAVP